jgi:ankyrin repeat protein
MRSQALHGRQRMVLLAAILAVVGVGVAYIGLSVRQRVSANHGLKLALDERPSAAAIRRWVVAGADVNCSSSNGRTTALMRAAELGDVQLVELLIRRGARIDAGKPYATPLYFAVSSGHEEAALTLLKRGAGANARSMAGDTVLMWAAANGRPRLVKALLDAGASVSANDDTMQTARSAASRAGHRDIVRMLDQRSAAQ